MERSFTVSLAASVPVETASATLSFAAAAASLADDNAGGCSTHQQDGARGAHRRGIRFQRPVVCDGRPHSGLFYPPSPSTNTAALRIMGLESNVSAPDAIRFANSQGIGTAGSFVLVADNLDNRVLVFPSFDSWPAESSQFSPSASQALGQTTMGTVLANQGNGVSSAATLFSPTDVAASPTELFVADTANHRVLVFAYNSSSVTTTASRVIGQLDFPDNAPNLVEGKEFNTISTATGFSGSAVLDFSATPPHLYVADTANNRILGYRNFSQAQEGVTADIVIGQPNFTSTEVNYPSGQSTQPNATGLNQPTALVVDSSGDIHVADALNSRVVQDMSELSRRRAAHACPILHGMHVSLMFGSLLLEITGGINFLCRSSRRSKSLSTELSSCPWTKL